MMDKERHLQQISGYMLQAHRARDNGHYYQAEHALGNAYMFAYQISDDHLMADINYQRGAIARMAKRYKVSERFLRFAYGGYERLDDKFGMGVTLRDFGLLNMDMGDLPRAREDLSRSIEILSECQRPAHLGTSQVKLGIVWGRIYSNPFDMEGILSAGELMDCGVESIKQDPKEKAYLLFALRDRLRFASSLKNVPDEGDVFIDRLIEVWEFLHQNFGGLDHVPIRNELLRLARQNGYDLKV